MTPEFADALITYLVELEDRVDHQAVMKVVNENGVSTKELDAACRALGALAGRDYSIL